jgi:hypothetical protein
VFELQTRDKGFLISISLLLTSLAVISILTPPADGYEFSLYEAYPWYFWMEMILALGISHLYILYSSIWDRGSVWAGAFAAVSVDVFLMSLPLVRGYELFGVYDIFHHINKIKEIQSNGTIGNNLYPLSHIQHEMINQVSDIVTYDLMMFLPVLYFLFYMIVIYLTISVLATSKSQTNAVFALVSLPIFFSMQAAFLPYMFSFFFFPVVFFAYSKYIDKSKTRDKSLLLILFVALVFFHPETSLFAFVILASYYLLTKYDSFINALPNSLSSIAPDIDQLQVDRPLKNPVIPYLIAGALYLLWYPQHIFPRIFRNIIWIFTGGGSPDVAGYSAGAAGYPPALLAEIIFFRFGQVIVLTAIAGPLLIYLLYREYPTFKKRTVLLISGLVLFTAVGVGVQFIDMMEFTRIARFIVLFAALATGFGLHQALRDVKHGRRALFCSLGIIILLVASISVANIYVGPHTEQKNEQHSNMNLQGSAWLIEHSAEDGVIITAHHPKQLAELAHRGTRRLTFAQPPEHIGITNETTRASYPEYVDRDPAYIYTSSKWRGFYPAVHSDDMSPGEWPYKAEDFDRLNSLSSKTYDNGESDVFISSNSTA